MSEALIVDDDDNNRLLLATLLEHAGHTPLQAGTGGAALGIAQDKRPALVIVDLSLPDMPGTELIKALRRDSRTSSVKIALYTATGPGAALDELCDLYGISAVIPKPGDPQKTLSLLRQLLEP